MAITKKQNGPKVSTTAANAVRSTKAQAKPQQRKKYNEGKDPMPMGKMNYILMGVSLFLIVLGFILMTGSSNEGSEFNNDVFSSRRIVVAPIITFFGFLAMIPAIMYRGRKKDEDVIPTLPEEGPSSNVVTSSNNVVTPSNNVVTNSNIIVKSKS